MGGTASHVLNSYFNASDEAEKINVENTTFDYSTLDDYTKNEIAKFIENKRFKTLDVQDDFATKIKNKELEAEKLIPMCLELYDILENNLPLKTNKGTTKKKFFVNPKFDESQVKQQLTIVNTDRPFQKLEKNLYPIPVQTTQMNMSTITVNEFDESFGNILIKRDMMGINKKVFKYMSPYMKQRFVNVYDEILKDLSNVNDISIGKGSYIYKDGTHGPTDKITSFRQIISLPNAVNHFHRILNNRLANYLIANKYVDTNIQKGGIAGSRFAIFEQYFKIKNVFKSANKNNKTVAVLFLDISNAFGNLNLENLYNVLEEYYVDKKFIDYLKEYYNTFQFYIDCGNIKTDTYKWSSGLVQGCSMSPLLFILALNYVLRYLDNTFKTTHGYQINPTTNILLTAFIDDIAIICDNVTHLNEVYTRLVELFTKLGLPINKNKSGIMTVNDNTPTTSMLLNDISKVNVYKYLGEYVSCDGSNSQSYTHFLRQITKRMVAIDNKKVPNTDKIAVFDSYLIPWIQRKTMAMYDLNNKNRLKIVSLVKPYLQKWNYVDYDNVVIFSKIDSVVSNSNDEIVNNIEYEFEDEDNYDESISLSNHFMRDNDITFDYNQINDNTVLELQLDM